VIFQDLAQDSGAGMLDVPGGGQQRDPAARRVPAEPGHGLLSRRARQLLAVAQAEFRETRRIMPIPPAQGAARRDILQPFVIVDLLLRAPAGPEPVDEHPVVTLAAQVVVDPHDLGPSPGHLLPPFLPVSTPAVADSLPSRRDPALSRRMPAESGVQEPPGAARRGPRYSRGDRPREFRARHRRPEGESSSAWTVHGHRGVPRRTRTARRTVRALAAPSSTSPRRMPSP
jgi:hypothetical protein